MSNELTKDPVTGFLESPRSIGMYAFSARSKMRFLELAEQFIREKRKFPPLGDLAETLGVNLATVRRHIQSDDEFAKAYDAVMLHGEQLLTEVMFDHAQKPQGFMDRVTWLRRHFPERWHPDRHVTITHRIETSEDACREARVTLRDEGKPIEAEIVAPKVPGDVKIMPQSQETHDS